MTIRRTAEAAAAVLAAVALSLHLQFTSPVFAGYDGYYHARYAWMLLRDGLPRNFPWAARSLWAEHFADKELLYHALLAPFTAFGDALGGVKVASALLSGAVLFSFWAILRREQVRWPWLWLLLLCASGAPFLARIHAVRPHVLSVLLVLWLVHALRRRRVLTLSLLSFVYTLSYTAVHLPLVLAGLVTADAWLRDRELPWRPLVGVSLATLAGLLVHPHFPDNLYLFVVQNFSVPRLALERGADLALANEFLPWSTRGLLRTQLPLFAATLVAGYLALARPRRASRRTTSLLLLAAAFVGLMLLMRRFVEYAAPLTVWCLASFFDDRLHEDAGRPAPRRAALAAAVLLLLPFAWRTYQETRPQLEAAPVRRDAALWLARNTAPDELVFTCDWDDPPELFFYNRHNRYPVMLDPTFFFAHDPEGWRRWSSLAAGEFGGRTYDVLREEGYRHGVCTADFRCLRSIAARDPRIDIPFDDGAVFVFRLVAGTPEIDLDRFLELNADPCGEGERGMLAPR